jgi:cytidylate kinase
LRNERNVVRVWTISWQLGTRADELGRSLARELDIALFDDELVTAVAAGCELDPDAVRDLERHLPGPYLQWGLSLAIYYGGAALAAQELQRPRVMREVTERAIWNAVREPCVIVGRGAFAVLRDHPGTLHLRVHAPLEWRVGEYARDNCVSLSQARSSVRRDDHARESYVRRLYGLELRDDENFDVVLDASRLSLDAMLDLALVAGERWHDPSVSRVGD